MIHVLGFDSTLYSTWLDSDTTSGTYSNVYTSPTVTSSSAIHASRPATNLLVTPNVLQWSRDFFSCTGLEGMPLENEDGSGQGSGSHW